MKSSTPSTHVSNICFENFISESFYSILSKKFKELLYRLTGPQSCIGSNGITENNKNFKNLASQVQWSSSQYLTKYFFSFFLKLTVCKIVCSYFQANSILKKLARLELKKSSHTSFPLYNQEKKVCLLFPCFRLHYPTAIIKETRYRKKHWKRNSLEIISSIAIGTKWNCGCSRFTLIVCGNFIWVSTHILNVQLILDYSSLETYPRTGMRR